VTSQTVLTGTSEETAICWWLAACKNMIWPEVASLSEDEIDLYDLDGDGDDGKIVLNYLKIVKGAKIDDWHKLSEDEKEEYRAHARRDPKRYKTKRVFINSTKIKPHFRVLRVKYD